MAGKLPESGREVAGTALQKQILTSKKSGGSEVLTKNLNFFAFWLFFQLFLSFLQKKKLNFDDFSFIFRLNLANATFATQDTPGYARVP